MKNIYTLLITTSILLLSATSFAQDIEIESETVRNIVTGADGKFIIANDDATNDLKLLLRRTGEVNWYLDKQLFFIRDGDFEAFDGIFTSYDFIHIDGNTGRIGFNVLSDLSYGELPLTSSVHLFGSIATRVRTLDGSGVGNEYEVKQDDHTLIVSLDNQDITLALPPVANAKGRSYRVKRDAEDGNNRRLTLQANGSELIDSSSSYEVSKTLGVVEIVCDGTQWWILSAEDQFGYAQPATTDVTLGDNDDIVGVAFSAKNENFNINLPSASLFNGKRFEIKRNVDGATFNNNSLFITPQAGDNLDEFTNAAPYEMNNNFESVTIQSNGTLWLIIGAYNN